MNPILDFMEIFLLFITLFITTTPIIDQMITYYRMQSGLVAIITGLAVIFHQKNILPIISIAILIAILPGSLALFIRPILARVTVQAPLADLFYAEKRSILQKDAKQVWLSHQTQSTRQPGWQQITTTLLLVSLAFLIAFSIKSDRSDVSGTSIQVGLAVSLALHLVGLYTMITRQDIISQIVGLLVMDHGIYLAVVKIVDIRIAGIFVLGLYFYTLITLFILFFLLPTVRQKTASIDLSTITDSSKLKG